MRARFIIGGLGLAALLCACDTLDSTKELMEKPRSLIDKATPTEAARARRAGLRKDEEIYFVTELDGQRRSSGVRLRKDTSFRDIPADLLETRQTFHMVSREGQRVEQTITRRVITTANRGEALYSSETIVSGGKETQATITIVDGQARFTDNAEGGAGDGAVPVPPGVLFGINPQWVLAQNPDVGNRFTAQVIDASSRQVVQETATVRNFSQQDVLGTQMGVWEIEIERENTKPVRMAFTISGDIVRQQADSLVSYVVPQAVAERDEIKMEALNSIPTSFPLPAWDNFNLISCRPQPFERWSKYLRESDYFQIRGEELLLQKYAPSVGPARFPLQPPAGMEEYLKSFDGIVPNDGDVRGLAKDVIGDEKNVLQGVALLAGWVYQNIAFERGQGANKNARETIRLRKGDHNAHADLFASLARSLNIPTRHCGGMLIQRDAAIYHTWCEVFIDGVWVPVDTTVNRVGLPAGYILTMRDEGRGVSSDPFAWALRESGLALEIVSATKTHILPQGGKREDFTLYPGQKKTYVAVAGDWLAHIYWGFSLYKPTEWLGNIGIDHVSVYSPDEMALIKIEALNKVLPCTESQLDMIISSLERSLKGFHKINQGRVLFGNRHDNSLFIDFSVEQENGARRRCQMYIIPKRGRSYRVTAWAPADNFEQWLEQFKRILDTVSL